MNYPWPLGLLSGVEVVLQAKWMANIYFKLDPPQTSLVKSDTEEIDCWNPI